jgi:hypothetical protein
MNSSNANIISSALLIAPFQLNIYLGAFIFITGNVGSICNMIVYRSRLFRARACAVYLLWEAFINLFYFNFVLLTRMLQQGYQIPVMNRYGLVCKLRQFASEYTHQVAFTLFTLAMLDRLLSAQRSIGEFENTLFHHDLFDQLSSHYYKSTPKILSNSGNLPPIILGSFTEDRIEIVHQNGCD